MRKCTGASLGRLDLDQEPHQTPSSSNGTPKPQETHACTPLQYIKGLHKISNQHLIIAPLTCKIVFFKIRSLKHVHLQAVPVSPLDVLILLFLTMLRNRSVNSFSSHGKPTTIDIARRQTPQESQACATLQDSKDLHKAPNQQLIIALHAPLHIQDRFKAAASSRCPRKLFPSAP